MWSLSALGLHFHSIREPISYLYTIPILLQLVKSLLKFHFHTNIVQLQYAKYHEHLVQPVEHKDFLKPFHIIQLPLMKEQISRDSSTTVISHTSEYAYFNAIFSSVTTTSDSTSFNSTNVKNCTIHEV